ncbi:hypothetical protein QP716_22230 [Citrobacter freundii]|uniref:hypothetical protein n=1 Tax=Citrobacter freundii TaxID=546 RepID=UPI001ED25214|nr:hypothetical protein [Citrobacter freundii]EGT0635632.1 hypothetical protein [Citrobacter freundii]MDK8080459.1 hypothetical protein [Citrobacter freundii]MDK8591572.1 hypothetical protein [Citrobacter freundii]
MLSHSFEDLAQAFRVLLESNWSLQRLLAVDRAEAIGNLESGLNTQLNAFHNLYDNMQSNQLEPDWYLQPELLMMLVIRNARHHNKANRIRSIYNYHRQSMSDPTQQKNYFYVNFPAPAEEEGGGYFDVPISWGDIDEMLSLPRQESRLRPEAKERIRNYLNANSFEAQASQLGFAKEDIFINYVPLSMSAGIALYPYIKDNVSLNDDSVEAKSFLSLFRTIQPALTTQHICMPEAFSLPI